MNNRHLTETTVNLIIDQLKAQLPGALSGVRSIAPDKSVTMDPPQSYFIYPRAKGYRTPAVFVIPQDMDFKQEERGQNFISALMRINLSVLLEDQDRERLTKRAWRYQAAMHQVLSNVPLTSSDSKVKAVVKVRTSTYSPMFTRAKNEDDPQAVFAIEVVLELDVDHFENF